MLTASASSRNQRESTRKAVPQECNSRSGWNKQACMFKLINTDIHGVKHTIQPVGLGSMKRVKELGRTFPETGDRAHSTFHRPHKSGGVPLRGLLTGQLSARDKRKATTAKTAQSTTRRSQGKPQ